MSLDPRATAVRPPPLLSTLADWLAIPVEQRAELIDGQLIYQALPGPKHGLVQGRIAARLDSHNRRPGNPDEPGGWWISLDVDLFIAGMGCRPDVLGWQRAAYPRMPEPDARGVVTAAPAWVCEVLSRSTAAVDMGAKRSGYHRAGVEWYWLADPYNRTLTVLRRTDPDYLVVAVAGPGERVRAEPFAGVEVDVDSLFDFGDEDPPRDG